MKHKDYHRPIYRNRGSVPFKKVRIIGLMSGTSHDGVDVALVEIHLSAKGTDLKSVPLMFQLVKHLHIPYRKPLRDEIRRAFAGNTERICRLNFRLGGVFADAVSSLLRETGYRPRDIHAVASHGQTICHIPPSGKRSGSTLQIGEASVIADRTGILTLSDFRTADMAAGGQGAPLVPLADYLLFRKPGRVRAVVNIGGIANVTIIKETLEETVAFDTGPGNSLIDETMRFCSGGKKSFDRNGDSARSGKPVENLLKELLSHPYFKKRPPKSTGRETFGAGMIQDIFSKSSALKKGTDLFLSNKNKSVPFLVRDILATLTHLTAVTLYNAIIKFKPDEVILTGGGVKNRFLVDLIRQKFEKKGIAVNDISDYGIPPQAKEAVSFAILGYQTLNERPGNLPSATGARHSVILGKISLPTVPLTVKSSSCYLSLRRID